MLKPQRQVTAAFATLARRTFATPKTAPPLPPTLVAHRSSSSSSKNIIITTNTTTNSQFTTSPMSSAMASPDNPKPPQPTASATTASTTTATTDAAAAAAKQEEPLPPLSDHDFRIFNHMADHMELYHTRFRQTWNLLWTACTTGKRPQGMSLRQFLQTGLDFASHLNAHHSIEEMHIFPILAKRMVEFDPKKGDLLEQHARIHEGLERFQAYLERCRSGEADFEMAALKDYMEPWGSVLWAHLDDEVRTLGADNMRKYWSKAEMQRMPM